MRDFMVGLRIASLNRKTENGRKSVLCEENTALKGFVAEQAKSLAI
jgi:hypothetical protein